MPGDAKRPLTYADAVRQYSLVGALQPNTGTRLVMYQFLYLTVSAPSTLNAAGTRNFGVISILGVGITSNIKLQQHCAQIEPTVVAPIQVVAVAGSEEHPDPERNARLQHAKLLLDIHEYMYQIHVPSPPGLPGEVG